MTHSFGTYEENGTESETQLGSLSGESQISPQWTSGDFEDGEYDDTTAGTHEYITVTALEILMNDKGVLGTGSVGSVLIIALISLASALPDDREVGTPVFVGHFYNPNTGLNYALSSTNTAKTNAQSRYDYAISCVDNGELEEAYEYLGRCLHYIQDVCVPHHAANVTVINPSHSGFERYAFDHMETELSSYTSISGDNYNRALVYSAGETAHAAATTAYPRIDYVNNIFDKSEWENQARICLRDAARFSAMILYKFSQKQGVPFIEN